MLSALQAANLGLRFLLELCALAVFFYWGFSTGTSLPLKLLLGIGAPVVAAVLWGLFAAPKANFPLPPAAHLAFVVVFFALAIAALIVTGHQTLGWIFAAVFVVNTALLYMWHQ